MSEWSQHIDQVAAQVVRIETQGMWGTGFVHYATGGGVRCIASARQVLEQPHHQGQRFRVWHGNRVSEFGGRGSKDALLVRLNDDYLDTAVVAVITHQLPKPVVPLISGTEQGRITAGMEVGWLGFPDLEGLRDRLCFFSGRISLVDPVTRRYLIDGTNVPGFSAAVRCSAPPHTVCVSLERSPPISRTASLGPTRTGEQPCPDSFRACLPPLTFRATTSWKTPWPNCPRSNTP